MKEKFKQDFELIRTILIKYRDLNLHEDLLRTWVYDIAGYPEFLPDDQELIDVIETETLKAAFDMNLVELMLPVFEYNTLYWEFCFDNEILNAAIDEYNSLDLENNQSKKNVDYAIGLMCSMLPKLKNFLNCWVQLRLKIVEIYGTDLKSIKD